MRACCVHSYAYNMTFFLICGWVTPTLGLHLLLHEHIPLDLLDLLQLLLRLLLRRHLQLLHLRLLLLRLRLLLYRAQAQQWVNGFGHLCRRLRTHMHAAALNMQNRCH